MTDDTSNDWSEKVNKLASRSKELASKGFESSKEAGKTLASKSKEVASKGYESSKEAGKTLASKSKEVASKGFESSKEAGKTLASKSKEVATKGVEGTKSAVQSISNTSHELLEKRKEKKAREKDKSSIEMVPQVDEIPVIEGETLESPPSEDYSGFTVRELKLRLKFLGLAVGGKKAALVERLKSTRKVKTQNEDSYALDDLELKIQRIEEEYPEVLKPLPPDKDEEYSHVVKNSFYYVCGFTLIVYSLLILLPAFFAERFEDSAMGIPFIEFFLPTWFSPEQIQPMDSKYHSAFVAIGSLVVFSSGVLLLQKKNSATTLLGMYFVGVLIIGRLVYFFQSDTTMFANDYSNLLHDLFLMFIVCGFAFLPRAFYRLMDDDTPLSLTLSGGKSVIFAEKPNTDGDLEHIIQEGFDMDFRTEVARPKTPRARAKFETYEKILLIVSLFLWPFTIFMTMAYDNGLVAFTEYSSEIVQVVSVWGISLLTLISLVRFDRSARGNGWHTKEKEIYVGMMDLYSKAQAKHYEYVELRAAAEAQEILEKYPQLDRSKSSSTSKA